MDGWITSWSAVAPSMRSSAMLLCRSSSVPFLTRISSERCPGGAWWWVGSGRGAVPSNTAHWYQIGTEGVSLERAAGLSLPQWPSPGAKRERRKRRQPLGAALAPLGREQRACLRRVLLRIPALLTAGIRQWGCVWSGGCWKRDGPVTRPLCAMGSTFTAYMHSSDVLNWCLNLGVLLFPALITLSCSRRASCRVLTLPFHP